MSETPGEALISYCKIVQCFLPVLEWKVVLVPTLIMLEGFPSSSSKLQVKIFLKLQDALALYNCFIVASQLRLQITNQAVLRFLGLNLKIWDSPWQINHACVVLLMCWTCCTCESISMQ